MKDNDTILTVDNTLADIEETSAPIVFGDTTRPSGTAVLANSPMLFVPLDRGELVRFFCAPPKGCTCSLMGTCPKSIKPTDNIVTISNFQASISKNCKNCILSRSLIAFDKNGKITGSKAFNPVPLTPPGLGGPGQKFQQPALGGMQDGGILRIVITLTCSGCTETLACDIPIKK